jgi:hypothetical protein
MRATISFVYPAPLTADSAPFSKAVFTSTSFEALSNQESTHGASASTSVLSPTTAPLPNDLSPIKSAISSFFLYLHQNLIF